ncbi:NAD-dependent SIR2 family protein deacetylase [Kineosphaera limosa]|uniref:protein acetyllysine N-acetyltransferase n=1 Tax=Kineosphaera limosa NBRC 100340 TaxID=1184609 RepID=K6WKL7_9MICO|nr:Sir2 family NAD-dependent protein deacetylase [Kineosphaera limosa]NYE02881.1 NAD-dependent SIR2 family protein deacetylase [Kineosphaera limosa]GAB94311.1 NAD-dependent deacetylase [Kineosphaera limosa NBRC 100340]
MKATDSIPPLRVTPSSWRPPPGALPTVTGTLADLRELVNGGGVVALTGAGMSTESGIPDYRGPDGARRVTPMTIDQFRDEYGARHYWSRAYVGWDRFRAARPNVGHVALAELERRGLVDAVITQNVDGLHQEAGSGTVLELHGTLTTVVCLDCSAVFRREHLQAALGRLNPGFAQVAHAARGSIRPDGDVELPGELVTDFRVAACEDCGGDQLKPDVVFFGESAHRDVVARCFERIESARSLLVLGSSLAVMSGLRFVRRAARMGLPVAIVTNGPTRGDELATLRLTGPLGEVLPALATAADRTT